MPVRLSWKTSPRPQDWSVSGTRVPDTDEITSPARHVFVYMHLTAWILGRGVIIIIIAQTRKTVVLLGTKNSPFQPFFKLEQNSVPRSF